MTRLQTAFLGLVAVSALVGGYTVVEYGDELHTADTIRQIQPQLSATVTDATLRGDELSVTVRLSNPSKLDLTLTGGSFRIHNRTTARLAYGAGRRVDDGPTTLPAGDSLTATYEIRVSDDRRRALASALERDAELSARIALELDGRSMTLVASDLDVPDGGG